MSTAAVDTATVPMNRSGDLMLPLALVGILIFMLIPLPAVLLDVCLAASFTIGLLIILVSLYTPRPLEFSTFPSLLLMVTLFRLSLNVASTRLVLLHGHEGPAAAGHVIQAFGNFVVGGSYVVGIVVFMILVLINWSVITRGTGRIAEVAARFTLDSMPGKQLAIDAELNNGLITEEQARVRRRDIESQADFYGAMDGAARFVRGDALAGIVITAINIVGGLVIGTFQRGLDLSTAIQTYPVLTIGDGLVSQLPGLFVSTAVGIIVTRAASEQDLASQVGRQLFSSQRVLTITAGFLGAFALVPGLPFLPFMILAVLVGSLRYVARTPAAGEAQETEISVVGGQPRKAEAERIESLLPLDIMELEVGYELVPLVDASAPGVEGSSTLIDRIKSLRRQFALDLGFVVPPIHIRDNLQRKPGEYGILLKGAELAKGAVQVGSYLAIDPGTVTQPIDGTPTREPAFGLNAVWITPADRERAQLAGYSVVDPATVVVTHLSEIVRRHAHELLGRQEVQGLLDTLARSQPKAIEELIPQNLSVGQVQKVLQNLLREGVSIRDLLSVVETLADHAPRTKNIDELTEYARQALGRSIARPFVTADGELPLVTLAPNTERVALQAVQQAPDGGFLALEPVVAQTLVTRIGTWAERLVAKGQQPVILCSTALRPYLRRLLERYLPAVSVLSAAEIPAGVRVQSIGMVALDEA